jgi:hypothetical protein
MAERSARVRAPRIAARLKTAEEGANLVRSFAYSSGPAWGTLLDLRAPGWSRRLKATDDLAKLTARAYAVEAAADIDARAERYRAAEVFTAEKRRGDERQQRVRLMRARYVDGPRLVIPLGQMQMQFDPNRVSTLEGEGTVYAGLTLSDSWGKIVAPGGALIASDYKSLVVPAPAAAGVRSGAGWELALSDGWQIVPGTRAGDFVLRKP